MSDPFLEYLELLAARDRIAELENQRDELLAALKKYGMHKCLCITDLPEGFADVCSCGLSKAIAKAQGVQHD